MSILNVNNINPVGSGRTITVNNDVDGAAVVDITGSLNVAAGDNGYFNVVSNKLYHNNNNVTLPTTAARDIAVFARNSSCTIIIATDSGSKSAIRFADENSNNIGQIQYDHSVDDMQFNVNGSERMRILSTGGITFNGDTATTNALDDYEEGTWTPTYTGQTTAGSYTSTNDSWYTKIGNMVTAYAELQNITDVSLGSGQLNIGGLPFANGGSNALGSVLFNSFNLDDFAVNITAWVGDGESVVKFFETRDNTFTSGVNVTDRTVDSADVYLQVTYKVN